MIIVESDGVSQLLNVLEKVVESGQPPTDKELDTLLSTESISFMVEAYSRWPDFSKEGFVKIIAHLTNADSIGQGNILSKLEEGFRSCLSRERISSLRQKLRKTRILNFTEAERIALKYLPPRTPIKSIIHLTIDAFNPGMVYKEDVGLSILQINPENFDFSYLAHELHHSGFRYWINHNPKLKNSAFKENRTHQEIAVNMILHLLSEGMANYYCTPNMVRTSSKASKKHNQKIKKYQLNLNRMLLEVRSLLSDCVSKISSIEACKKRLMNIILDSECILPPVHFIGANVIGMFDRDSTISNEEIVNLCKEPAHFFTLYSKVYEKYGAPVFPNEIIEHVSTLLE